MTDISYDIFKRTALCHVVCITILILVPGEVHATCGNNKINKKNTGKR